MSLGQRLLAVLALESQPAALDNNFSSYPLSVNVYVDPECIQAIALSPYIPIWSERRCWRERCQMNSWTLRSSVVNLCHHRVSLCCLKILQSFTRLQVGINVSVFVASDCQVLASTGTTGVNGDMIMELMETCQVSSVAMNCTHFEIAVLSVTVQSKLALRSHILHKMTLLNCQTAITHVQQAWLPIGS